MENKHLLTVEEFKELARPTSKHVDDKDVLTFIRECEDTLIVPAIGLSLCKKILSEESEFNTTLLKGGEYTDKCDELKRCAGLKLALAYFVYAKMTMCNGGMLTRTGMMQHNDSHAYREDDKNRVRRYNEAMNVAETYLNSCLAYIKAQKGEETINKVRGSRFKIHSIGE